MGGLMKTVHKTSAGSAATTHWWRQRLSALILLPLTLWFILCIAQLPSLTHAAFLEWIRNLWNATALSLFLIVSIFHAVLGLEVVIEDYVHDIKKRQTTLKLMRFILLLTESAAILAILKLVFPETP